MISCACSLAGTRACDTCLNGPSQLGFRDAPTYNQYEEIIRLLKKIVQEPYTDNAELYTEIKYIVPTTTA